MNNKPKMYIDTSCFVDMAKGCAGCANDAIIQKDIWTCKQILKASLAGDLQVYTSTLTIAECTHASGIISEEVKELFNKILTSGQYVILIQPSPLIAIRARDLRWVHGINLRGGADHIHVASALDYQCAEFLTTEFRTKRPEAKARLEALGLRVVRPSETALLPSDYRQEVLGPM